MGIDWQSPSTAAICGFITGALFTLFIAVMAITSHQVPTPEIEYSLINITAGERAYQFTARPGINYNINMNEQEQKTIDYAKGAFTIGNTTYIYGVNKTDYDTTILDTMENYRKGANASYVR